MQLFIATGESRNRVAYFLFLFGLVAFCATIFFKPSTNSIAVGIIVLSLLINRDFYRNIRQIICHPVIYGLLIFYGLHLLSVLNSANVDRAIKDLVLKLPLLVFPLAFRLYRPDQQLVNRILHFFVVVVIVISLYCLVQTFITMLHGADPWDFFSQVQTIEWGYFSYILPLAINGHAPYLSVYAGTAMLLGLSFLSKSGNKDKGWVAFYIFVVAYLFFFVILLASRTSFVALTLTLVVWLILELCRRKKYLSAFLGSAFLLALAAGALTFVPYLNNKVKNFDGLEDRKAMWTACLNIIREHPVFGVGTGDIKAQLLTEYKRINFQEGLEEVYNAHNQYFQTTLGLGGIGLVSLLAFLLLVLYQGWRKGNFFLISFTLVFGLCCLTESMLSRQSGVVLFSFILGTSLISLEKREIA